MLRTAVDACSGNQALGRRTKGGLLTNNTGLARIGGRLIALMGVGLLHYLSKEQGRHKLDVLEQAAMRCSWVGFESDFASVR